VEPFARLTYAQADMSALTETNGIAALSAAKQSYDLAIANLGLRVGTNLGDRVNLNASAAWQRTSGAREAMTIIGIPAVGQNGAIQSVALDPDAALLQADIGFNLSDRARINVGYSGLIGKNNSDHAGRATLSFAF
jgi:outer membrane autotransporter protein